MRARQLIDSLESDLNAALLDLCREARADTRIGDFVAWSSQGWIHFDAIRVMEEGKGTGTYWVKRLQAVARKFGQAIIVSPQADPGHKEDLRHFYRQLGFRPNRGRRSRSDIGGAFGGEWVWEP